jgi:predicted nuclease of predicted toxin-antitoxin system
VTVALYLDEHVHRAITLGLRLRGVDVLTVQEDGKAGASDPQVLDRAFELQRVMFSQDQDFLIEANDRQMASIPFRG